jgi:hypothetical protein
MGVVVRRNVMLLRWIVAVCALAYLALPSVASTREYRSREVTREFQGSIRARRPEGPAALVLTTERIISSRCLRRPRRSFKSAMADHCRRERQGPLGAEGLPIGSCDARICEALSLTVLINLTSQDTKGPAGR